MAPPIGQRRLAICWILMARSRARAPHVSGGAMVTW